MLHILYIILPGKTLRFNPFFRVKGRGGGLINLDDCLINRNNSHGFFSAEAASLPRREVRRV